MSVEEGNNTIDFVTKVLTKTQSEALAGRLLTDLVTKRDGLRKELVDTDAEITKLVLELNNTMSQATIARLAQMSRQRIQQIVNKKAKEDKD